MLLWRKKLFKFFYFLVVTMGLSEKLSEQLKDLILGASFVTLDVFLKAYGGHSLVRSYAHDTLLPLSAYFLLKSYGSKSKGFNAAFIFSGCSTFELAQAAGLYPGTYDPNDFIAYAAGTVLGLGIDSVLSKKQGKSLQYDK